MVKFTAEELLTVMNCKQNIRHLSVIGNFDHGKSTLTASLVSAVAGSMRMTKTRADEAESDNTIKSNGYSLHIRITDAKSNESKYLINVLDSPGHADYSPEVTCALRISDGAVLVIDCIEGVCVGTDAFLRQAVRERIHPILFLNKMDNCFLKFNMNGEDAYRSFHNTIKMANLILDTHKDSALADVSFDHNKGNIAFSSGLHDWAFKLSYFAKMYAKKYPKIDESTWMTRLWGDHFCDEVTKEWTVMDTKKPTCKRGFVKLCYDPIKQIINACIAEKKDALICILNGLGIPPLNDDENNLMGEQLVKCVLKKWLPGAAETLVKMTISHLPSPVTAQQYRFQNLYSGPLYDEYSKAIKRCDTEGPLMLYVSKLIPASDKGDSFFAFGRIFSGKVKKGMNVRIMEPNCVDQFARVEETLICMGTEQETIDDVPCGNMVALVGIDKFITKSATLTNKPGPYVYPFRAMKFLVSPVMRVGVQCMSVSKNPKLLTGLKKLDKSDLMVAYTIEETGKHLIVCAGELHLKMCLRYLKDYLEEGLEINVSGKVVSYRETVLTNSSRTLTRTSPNTHNSLHMIARPLIGGLAEAIDEGRVDPCDDPMVRSEILSDNFNWDQGLAENIWCFGPETNGPNMVVDRCEENEYLNEIKDSVIAGFQSASEKGALAEEKMRGICFELVNAELHALPGNRGDDEITLTAKSVIYASQLDAMPRLLEPVYLVEFQTLELARPAILYLLNKRHGKVTDEMHIPGTPLYNIKAFITVAESFGLSEAVKVLTKGQASSHCVYNHWELIPSDPLDPASEAGVRVREIRKFKGLEGQMPQRV